MGKSLAYLIPSIIHAKKINALCGCNEYDKFAGTIVENIPAVRQVFESDENIILADFKCALLGRQLSMFDLVGHSRSG